MKNALRSTLVGCLTLAAASFAQSGSQGQTGIQLPKDEKEFVSRLHQGHQTELKAAQLAKDRAQSPQVKDFANAMMTDHRQLDDQLMTFTRTQKWTVSEPKNLTDIERKSQAAKQANLAKLQSLSGPVFDQSFMAMMVEDHDHMLTKLITAQNQYSGNAQLVTFIQQAIPRISQHRDQAYQILQSVKPNVQMGTGTKDPQGGGYKR